MSDVREGRLVRPGSGHLIADDGEGEILDELMARARPVVAAR